MLGIYIIFTPSDFTNTLIFVLKSLIRSQVVRFYFHTHHIHGIHVWNLYLLLLIWYLKHPL